MSADAAVNGVVLVNGERRDCALPIPVAMALLQWGFETAQVAVAVNGEFVPRSAYADRMLHAGDAVDVLSAVQGG
ncbi:MAG: sulfur carrier protein ThiS [Gammaproteobacteria bacterium]|nr:MAG: sulfur carrier protein ThiS [Gammaproteobacteria bacterium]